jgi:peptidoglycan hydrolase CwlO-like protein
VTQPFVAATAALLDTLAALADALTGQRVAEARALLATAAPGVAHYLAELEAAIGDADAQIADLSQRAGALSDELASEKDEIAALDGQITRLNAEIAGLNARRADLALKHATLAPLVQVLAQSVRIHQQKLDELKTWFWVPGYGQYLAIRTLVDEDISGLQTAQHDLRDNARQLEHDERASADLQATLHTLAHRLRDMRDRVADLQRLVDRADHELARAKARTAFLIDARSFMADLQAMAANFDAFSLPRLAKALSQLNGPSLDSRMSVLNRQANTFAHDLREFALAIDARESFLTHAPPSGNVVEVVNRGAFVLKTRFAPGGDGAATAAAWSGDTLAGGSRQVDLRGLGLADGAMVSVEAAIVLGPTLRSEAIRYIEQPAAEIARFTAAGTVFAAALHHEP